MGVPIKDAFAVVKAEQGITLANGAAYDGTDLTGEEIDRAPGNGQRYLSAKIIVETGGGSASDVVDLKLFEADETGGSYTEVTDVTIPNLEDADGFAVVDVDLSSLKKVVQLQAAAADQTVSTTIDLVATVLLGGAVDNPVTGSA